MSPEKFATQLLTWYVWEGRKDLPWRQTITPYRVWVSEIMLQQTQVSTVIPYYEKFMERFPEVHSLAVVDLDEVLHLWSGLGYYARARNLHCAARIVDGEHQGRFPASMESLIALPGIGRSTAGAILSLACGLRAPILDGNVKRVLCRYHTVAGWPGQSAVARRLWQLAEEYTPEEHFADYTQAIMDLGATVCLRRQPRCDACPLTAGCQAHREGTQHSYPQTRAARELPVKKVLFAMLENQFNEILLEQRPPAGIWGGLWSFPEHETGFDIKDWITHDLGLTVEDLDYHPLFRHTFSHYHLDITPVHIKVKTIAERIREPGRYRWFSREDKPGVGLPAPVNRLIQQL